MKLKFTVDVSSVKLRNPAAQALAEGRVGRHSVHRNKKQYTRKQKHKKLLTHS